MAVALEEELRALFAANPKVRIGLFYKCAEFQMGIAADQRFHAASTMKVPVMMELFRQSERRLIDLSGTVLLQNEFRSILDDSTFQTDAADDSDPGLYEKIGGRVPLRELIERMIAKSSNLATNVLVELARVGNIQSMLHTMGCSEIEVVRGVEDGRAYRAGLINSTTANALGRLFSELVFGPHFSAASKEEMLAILSRQEHRSGIPAGLKSFRRVCHKTGWNEGYFHDAGWVELNDGPSFILAVLTHHSQESDPDVLSLLVAEVAQICARDYADR